MFSFLQNPTLKFYARTELNFSRSDESLEKMLRRIAFGCRRPFMTSTVIASIAYKLNASLRRARCRNPPGGSLAGRRLDSCRQASCIRCSACMRRDLAAAGFLIVP
jgi:hypothetical protein